MAGIQLKVSPDTLKAKANEVQAHITKFEREWKQFSQVVHNTKSYWVGEASNSHQRQFREYEEDVMRIIHRFREHPDDLLKMANLYEEAEAKVVQITQVLPDDVII